MSKLTVAAAAVLLAGAEFVQPACAQSGKPAEPAVEFSVAAAAEARKIVESATAIVQRMTSDDRLADLLKQSKGVFILPNVLKGGQIVGGRGGEGVLLTHEEGAWSNPAFFGLGAITLGAQAGGAVGPVVMLLMTEEAVGSFTQEDDEFALDASAGLSVFGYDVAGRTDTRAGDVIVWSDQGGAFAGATIGASDISIDDEKNHAYYRRRASLASILAGEVENPHLKLIQEKLPAGA